MPELPEIETIKLGLQKRIIGLKIQKIQILSPKSFIGSPNLVEGKEVVEVWRRAKLLGIDLSNKLTLLTHLKMSGQLVWEGQGSGIKGHEEDKLIGGHPTEDMRGKMPNSHTRVIFSFSDGSHLYFNDQRRFGWIKTVQSEKLKVQSEGILGKLGPEPFDKNFTWQVLKKNLLRHKGMPVKVAIMDQTAVAGVGNIYANEACFNGRLDPRRKVSDLSDKEFQALYQGMIKALKDGIAHGGSTRAHFVDAEGHRGYFLDYAYVYGRDKHPCKVCGTEVKKITLGGRGTYYCPNCQKMPAE